MTSPESYIQQIPVGEQLGYLEYTVTADKLRRFREAVGYPEAAFPNLAAREYREVLTGKYDLPALVSIRHTDRYYRPPALERRLQVTGWVREKYQARGADRLVVATFAVDEIGTEILRSEHTFQFGPGQGAERQGRRPARPRRTAGAESLPSLEKRVTEEGIERFEQAGRFIRSDTGGQATSPLPSNVHTGAELARDMGLAAAVAPGELAVAYLHELLDRHFGIDFRQGGRLSVDFLRPVYAGDTLTAQGLVVKRESANGPVNWQVQVWLTNQRGERAAAGEAQVTVPSPLT